MRYYDTHRRPIFGALFAVAAGVMVWLSNPVDRLKAEVRADTKGFVLSLEYTAKLVG
ncbi:hypothetical protein [Sphingomonas sp. G-3-2-10]|uniref:hypothetical protein n=1 Tax=Sphingomonas sp. G-3-2-10 TaxID=2728838 RepID=UPI00146D14D8|nr:hypothetical protein [Sphingomonas sp. G-3-2-10]NML05302.1 hypothetical protein [Sphingomonas sp. G-3-2-10]